MPTDAPDRHRLMQATDFPAQSATAGWKKIDLRRVAPRVAKAHAALTRLVGQGLQLPLSMPGAVLTLRQVPAQDLAWSAPLQLAGPMGRIELGQGARLLNALTGIDPAAMSADDGYPEWFVAALTGRLGGTALQGFHRIEAGGTPDPGVSVLQLSLSQQGHEFAVPARATPATWLSLIEATRRLPLRLPQAAYLDLAVDAVVRVARHRLPASALHRLEAGDIILPHGCHFAPDGTGAVRLGGRHWRVRYAAPCHLHLIAAEENLDHEHTEETAGLAGAEPEAQTQGAEVAVLDEVQMTISFELGRVSMSLGALRSLGPHTVLTLQDGAPESIALVCGGRTVGRGEAVDVDGVLGVRITQWSGSGGC